MKISDEDNNNKHSELAKKLSKILDEYSVDIGLNTLISLLIAGTQAVNIKKGWFITQMSNCWDCYEEKMDEKI